MSQNSLSSADATQIILSNMLVNAQLALYPIKEARIYGTGVTTTPHELVEQLKNATMKGIPELTASLLGEKKRDHGMELFESLFKVGYEFPNKKAIKIVNSVIDESKRHLPIMTSDATLEGEGPEIGKPTLLTRIGGCAVRCLGCDTPHSWNAEVVEFDGIIDPTRREYNQVMKVSDVADLIVQQAGYYGLKRVSITGGEPLHYIEALRLLVADLWLRGFYINIETSGTLFDPIVFAMCHVSVDIKTPSSRVELSDTQIGALHAVASYEHASPAHVKAVIKDDVDLNFLKEKFSKILNGNGVYRTLCLTPWAYAVQEDVDPREMSSNIDQITKWVFDHKRELDSRQVRVIAQQHKLMSYV